MASAAASFDLRDRLRVLERREIPRRLAEICRANHAAHYLGVACLREIGNELDPLGPQRLPEMGRDQRFQVAGKVRTCRVGGSQNTEADKRLTLEFVGDADG